jgi:hypothetical protein
MMNNNMDRPWFASYEPNVPRSVEIPNVTLNHFLAESTRKYPYNTATNFVLSYLARGLYTVGGKMTYQKLSETVDRFANALYSTGGSERRPRRTDVAQLAALRHCVLRGNAHRRYCRQQQIRRTLPVN